MSTPHAIGRPAAAFKVIDLPTPTGVEHPKPAGGVTGSVHVIDLPTPTGVEHHQIAELRGLINCDRPSNADRR